MVRRRVHRLRGRQEAPPWSRCGRAEAGEVQEVCEVSVDFRQAASFALANWMAWEKDYTHPTNEPKTLPVLQSSRRFSHFCSDYSLSRNIPGSSDEKNRRKKKKMALYRRTIVRRWLCENIDAILLDYKVLDDKADEMAAECNKGCDRLALPFLPYSPKTNNKTEKSQNNSCVLPSRSLLSKVCSFIDPINFPPFDNWASKGLGSPKNYTDFRDRFEEGFYQTEKSLRNDDFVNHILELFEAKNQRPFYARIFDNYLMQLGRSGQKL